MYRFLNEKYSLGTAAMSLSFCLVDGYGYGYGMGMVWAVGLLVVGVKMNYKWLNFACCPKPNRTEPELSCARWTVNGEWWMVGALSGQINYQQFQMNGSRWTNEWTGSTLSHYLPKRGRLGPLIRRARGTYMNLQITQDSLPNYMNQSLSLACLSQFTMTILGLITF